jgi:RNA polymerase sigma-70 factor (ECF subfamily)
VAVLEHEWLSIYHETVHPLYGYIARRTGGNRELTEDIVQESYLRALDSWNLKKKPDSPLAWLKRVARNVLIDYLRRRKREAPDGGNPGVNPRFRTSGDEIRSLELFLAMASLGGKKARIIEAFYYEGLSVKEIAGELRVSERAVEGRLGRARQSLKSLLPGFAMNGGKHEREL